MEELLAEGRVRAIGVSNFEPAQLTDLIANHTIVPAINQIETHAFFQQPLAHDALVAAGVQMEGWAPFAEGRNGTFTNSTLASVGARMIEERGKGIEELSAETTEALAHLILSHHGAYEYQSPKLPMTAEALAVHHLDNLDAKLNAFRSAMLRDRDPDSHWTEWNRMFERKLFKGHEESG